MFGIGLPEVIILVFVAAMVAMFLNSRRRGGASTPPNIRARRIKILGWYIIIITLLRLLDEFPFSLSLGGLLLGYNIWFVFAVYFILFVCFPGILAFGLLTKRNWARWGWIVFGIINVTLLELGKQAVRVKGQVFMPIFGDLLTLGWIVSLFWLFKRSFAADFKKHGDYDSREEQNKGSALDIGQKK